MKRALIFTLVLFGCVEEFPPESPAWYSNTPQEEIAAYYAQRCRAAGVPEAAMPQCILDQESRGRQSAKQRQAAVFSNLQVAPVQPVQQPVTAPAMRVPTRTVCTESVGIVTCTTN